MLLFLRFFIYMNSNIKCIDGNVFVSIHINDNLCGQILFITRQKVKLPPHELKAFRSLTFYIWTNN